MVVGLGTLAAAIQGSEMQGYRASDVGCRGMGQWDAELQGWGYTLQSYGMLGFKDMGLRM